MTALILHPTITSLRQELRDALETLQHLQSIADGVLRQIAEVPAIKALLQKVESESHEIVLLMASCRTYDSTPTENITGETRSLRSFLDGDVTVRDQVTAARCRYLYRRLAQRFHPRDQDASASSHLLDEARIAHKAQALEVLYCMYLDAYKNELPFAAEEGSEDDLLKKLLGSVLESTDKFRSSLSFRIAAAWMAGGKPLAEELLENELLRKLQAFRLYRTRKQEA